MAFLFSAVSTRFLVRANGHSYWTNCAWDMLGVPAALHSDAEIEAEYAEDGSPARLSVQNGRLRAMVRRPLPAAAPALVRRPSLHLSEHPALPVGAGGRRVVRGLGETQRGDPHVAEDVGAVRGMVRKPAVAGLPRQDSRGDKGDLRARRAQRHVLAPVTPPQTHTTLRSWISTTPEALQASPSRARHTGQVSLAEKTRDRRQPRRIPTRMLTWQSGSPCLRRMIVVRTPEATSPKSSSV